MSSWNLTEYLKGLVGNTQSERIPEEKDLPHTYKCACDVKWVAKGLEPQPCWACGIPVKPDCFHI